jgi:hypothetical protein
MTSKRKLAANRRNAANSTGPNTVDGKARASRNAYKHGLAVRFLNDPAISAKVEQLARSIAGKRSQPYELMQARIIAEAELDVIRVRAIRATIINSAAESLSAQSLAEEAAPEPHTVAALPVSQLQSEDVLHGLLRTLPQVEKLERYERRALSRRRQAVRQMYKSSM